MGKSEETKPLLGTTKSRKENIVTRVPTKEQLLEKPAPDYNLEKEKRKKKSKEPEMDVRAEFWVLFPMALQVSVSTFARIALTSIDSAFLGHVGTKELAAASLANVWTSVPISAVWAGASSMTTLCGQAWGAGNGVLAGIWLQMGIVVTSFCSIFVIILYCNVEYALEASTDDPEVIRLGSRFSRILSLVIWPQLTYACIRLYFQSMGITTPTTIVGATSIGVAVAANYYLIYGFLGWEGLGFDGSPLASAVASWYQPIMLVWYCIFYKKMHRQAWGGWNLSELTMRRFKIFMSISGPVASNGLLAMLSNSVLSLVAMKLGPDIIAANAIISGLWGLLWALFFGFGIATQVRVANYLGSRRPFAAQKVAMLGFCTTSVVVACLAIVALFLSDDLFRLYTEDNHLLNLCLLVQPMFVCAFFMESIEILSSCILTAMGEVKIPAFTSVISTWLVQLPTAYIGGIWLGFGFPALWYGILFMEAVKLTVFLAAITRTDWKQMSRKAAENMEMKYETTDDEGDDEALRMAMVEADMTPNSMNAVVRSPMTPQAINTPQGQRKTWDKIEEDLREEDSGPKRRHQRAASSLA